VDPLKDGEEIMDIFSCIPGNVVNMFIDLLFIIDFIVINDNALIVCHYFDLLTDPRVEWRRECIKSERKL
jgi:hypothetical protein